MAMNPGVIAAIAYGSLSMVGGIMGYIQAQSKISLISGMGCGLLLLISAFFQFQGQTWGLIVSVAVTIVLLLAFTMRLIKTRKFMPAGLMLILGIPALMVMIRQMI
ncbi:MAG: TMEM14 family protein [Leptolyngbyaceae cyanobacterium MO_188.B28]|nr:TMEM14 family protein [Leptolyngbyaceae cyanobacterium MO_188.B28]